MNVLLVIIAEFDTDEELEYEDIVQTSETLQDKIVALNFSI
jgi:hypothetical protein